MPYTVFDLANGEVILSYNGKDKLQLTKVLAKAFPNDNANKYLSGVHPKFYYQSKFDIGKWTCSLELPNDKPVQSLALFEI